MWLSFIALTTIFPAVFQAFRETASRDAVFWGTLAVGIAGPLAWVSSTMLGVDGPGGDPVGDDRGDDGALRRGRRHLPTGLAAEPVARRLLLLGLGAIIWQNARREPLQAVQEIARG